MRRRGFLIGIGTCLAMPYLAGRANAQALHNASMRGSINPIDFGFLPDAPNDQSRKFVKILAAASLTNQPVFLPSGTYVISNIALPKRVRITGVPGASRIVYGGDGFLFAAESTEILLIDGVTFDGANRGLGDQAQGLIEARRVPKVKIDTCEIFGSVKHGIVLEGSAGRVERTSISGAADAGIWSVEGAGVTIADNSVTDCANGGILVHRWADAEDGTIVSGNRVERIGSRSGGTGQNGNGINVFRAANVQVSGNQISNCDFSAIRCNSASNALIFGNTCRNSGETAIYSEFKFEGSVIADNIVDGAANGISVVNFNEGGRLATVSGNIVRNLTGEGPYRSEGLGFGNGISVEADTTVTGNTIDGAPGIGIALGWGPYLRNVAVTGNMIRNANEGVAVSVAEGAGKAVITGNVFDNMKTGSVFGHAWDKIVSGDMAKHGNQGYENVTVERNEAS